MEIDALQNNGSPTQARQGSSQAVAQPVLYYVYPLSIYMEHDEAITLLSRSALVDLMKDFFLHVIFLDHKPGRDDCLVIQAAEIDSLKQTVKSVRKTLDNQCRSFRDTDVLKDILSLRSEEMLVDWSHNHYTVDDLPSLPAKVETAPQHIPQTNSSHARESIVDAEKPDVTTSKEAEIIVDADAFPEEEQDEIISQPAPKLKPLEAQSSDMAISQATEHDRSTPKSARRQSSDINESQPDEQNPEDDKTDQSDDSFHLYSLEVPSHFRPHLLGRGKERARIKELQDMVHLEEPLYIEDGRVLHIMGPKAAIQECIVELSRMGREAFLPHGAPRFEPRFDERACKIIKPDGPVESYTTKRFFIQGSTVEDALYSGKLRSQHKLYIAVYGLVDARILNEEGDRYLELVGTPEAIYDAEPSFKRLLADAEDMAAQRSDAPIIDFSQVDFSSRQITLCTMPLPYWLPKLLTLDKAAILKALRAMPGVRFCDVRDNHGITTPPSPVLMVKGDRIAIKEAILEMAQRVDLRTPIKMQNNWFAIDGAAASTSLFGPPSTSRSRVPPAFFAPERTVTYFLPIPAALARPLLLKSTRLYEQLRMSVPALRRAACKAHIADDPSQYSQISYVLLHGIWAAVSEAVERIAQYGRRLLPWWDHRALDASCGVQEDELSSDPPSSQTLERMHTILSVEMPRSLAPNGQFWLDPKISIDFQIPNIARGVVFGAQKSTLFRLESESFASINVDRNDRVTIEGFSPAVRCAAQKVVDILVSPHEHRWRFDPPDSLRELLSQSPNQHPENRRKRSASPSSSADKRLKRTSSPWE